MSPIQKSPKVAKIFRCENCDYECCKQCDFTKHTLTQKHQSLQDTTLKVANTSNFVCNCGKTYKHSSSLYAHKKTCVFINKDNTSIDDENTHTNTVQNLEQKIDIFDLVKFLIKENSEIKHMMIEQQGKMMEQQNMMIGQQNIVLEIAKNGTHNTTNSHNKAFNLNVFLNETCKDAMNINDFVESIKLQVSDLENVGEVGFVEGISNIIVKNLNALDITKRPVHCTDKKRETIYIKDENVWEKDESQCKMRRMIKKVVSKNQRLIPKFKEQNPEYNKSYSKVSDKYNKLIIESMGGSGDNDLEKEDKIVRNIVKNVVVDKCL
jgi:uncharacterized Zn-finger protein